MNYGSICSGVEAATLAWAPLGWKAVFFAETEPFPAAVLQRRFGATRPLRPLLPEDAENEKDAKTRESWQKQIAELTEEGTIPNLGDFTKITKEARGLNPAASEEISSVEGIISNAETGEEACPNMKN